MTVGKVKDFNFSSSGKTVGLCNESMTKYAKGGQAVRAPAANMKAGRAAAGKAAIPPQMPMKKGGVKKFADGGPAGMPAGALAQLQAAMPQQKMPADAKAKMQMMARAAMAQKMAQAQGRPPMASPQGMPMPAGRPAMKKGGFVERGTGMIPNKGTLGVKGNKNPGEMGGKAPVKSHPKYNYADGGDVTVTSGNPNRMQQRQMMQQARRDSMQQSPLQQMRQPPMPPMGQQAGRQVLPSRPMVPPRPQVMPPQQPPMGQQGMPPRQTEADIRSIMQQGYDRDINNPQFKSLPPAQQQQYQQAFQQQLGMAGNLAAQQNQPQVVGGRGMALPPMGPPQGMDWQSQQRMGANNIGVPPMGQSAVQMQPPTMSGQLGVAPGNATMDQYMALGLQPPPNPKDMPPPMGQSEYYKLQASSPGMPPPMSQSAGQMQPPSNSPFNLSSGFNVGQPMGNQQASQMAQQPPQGMPMQQPMGQSGVVSSMPPQRMGGIG
jgi:hypothetical protein